MKVALIDVDSKMSNLAILKLSAYFKRLGWIVRKLGPEVVGEIEDEELVLASKIFTYSDMPDLPKKALVGGTGTACKDLFLSEIDDSIDGIFPDYSLYPDNNYSVGFTTRGCIRKCDFCLVPKIEGKIKAVADIYDMWDKRHKDIILLDNNILALPNHFFHIIKQLKREKLKVDFSQGLDHRLLTLEMAEVLKGIRHSQYRFAFDKPEYARSVERAVDIINKADLGRCSWYVLVGFDTTIEQDLFRLDLLRELDQDAFVQRYDFCKDKLLTAISRWANQHHLFRKMTFREFLEGSIKAGYVSYRNHIEKVYG